MSLIDDIKSVAKEGADLSGIEGQIGSYINSSELTKDNFIEVAKKHPNLMSAYDSLVSKSVENGVNNFKEKGMAEILKAKEDAIRAEINPKETPEQKRIRELEAKIQASEDKEILSTRKDELSIKAKELGFDTILAKDLAKLENADDIIKGVVAWKDALLGEALKGKFINKPPSTGGIEKGLTNMTDSELYSAAQDPANKPAILEEIKRRSKILK